MKKRMPVIISSVMILMGAISHAAVADSLKPVFQRQERDLRRLMDKWMADGMEYDIKVEEYTIPDRFMDSQVIALGKITCFRHFVSLPPEIEREFRKIKIMDGFVREYINNPTYSFAIAVLNVAFHRDGFSTRDQPLSAIVNKDKDEWNKNGIKTMLEQKQIGEGRRYEIEQIQWYKRYEQEIFSCSIPAVYTNEIPSPDTLLNKNTFRMGMKFKYLAQDVVKEIARGRRAMSFKKFPTTPENLEKWLHLCVHDEKSKLPNNHFGFIKWCRENKPATKPHLLAIAMALFTVDGYAFNDETGVYTLNERGKMLMDFIVEFPIPENATRLQAVMNGGNKDEIEAMMKKHGTTEKWAELLKNPVHPEFAKYPQDQMQLNTEK